MHNDEHFLDELSDEFEKAWQSNQRPSVEEYLNRVEGDARASLLRKLLPLDAEYRQKASEAITVDEYRELCQAHGIDATDCLRRVLGVTEDLTELHVPETTKRPNEPSSIQIGSYKLLQPIGEGGMGTVWMAEQSEPVKRRVALKVIKKGIGSKEVIARFDAERQALALMNHPNIARILDAGTTPDGQPYFAMELVQGKPFTNYCDENKLGIEERLELFADVCSGVQHAHQKGIIHRDLKPSNILVTVADGKPVPKIIDFGLAKAMESTQKLTEQSLFTGIGQILGTLKYMSPEQASLDTVDIDTRTDIYAMGVILYELLTGSTPLDDSSIKGQAALKVLEFIREKEPIRPSSKLGSSTDEQVSAITRQRKTDSVRLNRILAGDLDWIVMKALEKDRNRRYESASGFAADVRRYLNSEPVVARPPSLNYQVRKFVRKNRAGVIAASLVILSLVGGIVGTSLAMFRAWTAENLASDRLNEAIAAKEKESEQRQLAETRKQEAVREKETAEQNLAYAKKGNEILGSVFANLDPKAEYREVSDLRNALRGNLEKAVKELEGSAIGDPIVVAEMQESLGLSLLGLGQISQAILLLERSSNTRTSTLGPYHHNTLTAMGMLGMCYRIDGQVDKALPLLERTQELLKTHFGPDHPSTLTSMNNLAMGYEATGQLEKAIPLFEQTLELRKATLGQDHPDTFISVRNLANCYEADGQREKSMPLFEQILELRKAQLGPDHPDTLTSMNDLANGFLLAGQHDKALPLFVQTLELRTAQLGPDHPSTQVTMSGLADGYRAVGELNKALPLYERALELGKTQLGDDHPNTLRRMNRLAECYQFTGDLDKALPLYELTLELSKAKLGPDHPDTIRYIGSLAIGYEAAGQLDKALPLFEQTLEMRKTKLGPDHPSTLTSMNNLAMGYKAFGQLDKALPLFEQTLELKKTKFGSDHPSTLASMNNLAQGYQASNQLEKALLLFEQTLELKKTKLGPDHPSTLTSMNNLAEVYRETGQIENALQLHERTLNLKKIKLGADHPDTLVSMNNLALSYDGASQQDMALPLFEEAFKLTKAKLGTDHPDTLSSMNNLMSAYARANRPREFASLFETAVDLWRNSFPASSPQLAGQFAQAGVNLLQLKQFSKAEGILRQCLTIRQETQADLWSTFNTQSLLGGATLGLAHSQEDAVEKARLLAEAESLLIAGYEGMKKREATIPPQSAIRIRDALDRLIELYTAMDKPDEAQKYRELRSAYPNSEKDK